MTKSLLAHLLWKKQVRSSALFNGTGKLTQTISPHRPRALAGAGSMSDSEELSRKTSKGFCSDSLSLPDDAEEDEAEEEAFLLATASLRSGCWQLSGASPQRRTT